MAQVAIFDINETTLDLDPVRRVIDQQLGRPGAFSAWFGRLLQTSMAVTATGGYRPFGELAALSLESIAVTEGVDVAPDAWSHAAAAMATLPAHGDVAEGLDLLRAQGWRLIALTNSAQAAVDAQLASAGIHDRFEVVSVDQQGRVVEATLHELGPPQGHLNAFFSRDSLFLTEADLG